MDKHFKKKQMQFAEIRTDKHFEKQQNAVSRKNEDKHFVKQKNLVLGKHKRTNIHVAAGWRLPPCEFRQVSLLVITIFRGGQPTSNRFLGILVRMDSL